MISAREERAGKRQALAGELVNRLPKRRVNAFGVSPGVSPLLMHVSTLICNLEESGVSLRGDISLEESGVSVRGDISLKYLYHYGQSKDYCLETRCK